MNFGFKSTSVSVSSVFVVLILFLSLGLHSIQIAHGHHTHPDSDQQENEGLTLVLGEYMHMSDKKLFAILSAAFLLAAVLAPNLQGSWKKLLVVSASLHTTLLRRSQFLVLLIFNYLELCFSRGILHTRIH